jgi:hypothetical protein
MVLVGTGRAGRCGERGDVGPKSLSQSDRGSAGSVELLAEVVLLDEKLHCLSLHASSRSIVLAFVSECLSAKLSESIFRKTAGTATVSDIFICFDSNAQAEDTCDCPLGDATQLAARSATVSSHSRLRFESFLSKTWLLSRAASVRSKLEGECGVFELGKIKPSKKLSLDSSAPVGEDSVKSNKGDNVSEGLLLIGEAESLTSLTLGAFCGCDRCGDDTVAGARDTTAALHFVRLAVTVD